MNSLRAASLLAFSLFSPAATAQWWNPFGPKSYEDCVLEGVKTAKTRDAVTAVQYACLEKFPPKGRSDREISREAEQLSALAKKCRLPDDADGKSVIGVSKERPQIQRAVNNLTNLKFGNQSGVPRISFQNRNHFSVTVVALGFTRSKSCPVEGTSREYEAVVICADWSPYPTGIGAGLYGTLTCQKEANSFSIGYCPVGLRVENPYSRVDLAKVLDRYGLCD